MVDDAGILELAPVQDLERGNLSQIIGDQYSANFVIEKLFLDSKNGGCRVAVRYEVGNSIPVRKTVQILLEIKLISIVFLDSEVLFFLINPSNDLFHDFSRFIDSPEKRKDKVDFVWQHVVVAYRPTRLLSGDRNKFVFSLCSPLITLLFFGLELHSLLGGCAVLEIVVKVEHVFTGIGHRPVEAIESQIWEKRVAIYIIRPIGVK